MKLSETLFISSIGLAGIASCSDEINSTTVDAGPQIGVQHNASNENLDAGAPSSTQSSSSPQIMLAPERGELQGPIVGIDLYPSKGKKINCESAAINLEIQSAINTALKNLKRESQESHLDSIRFSCCPPNTFYINVSSSSGKGDSTNIIPIFKKNCTANQETQVEEFFGGAKINYSTGRIEL